MNSYFNENTYEELIDEIKYAYLSDIRPWIIGYSGGKDSTTVVELVYEMLRSLKADERIKNVYIVSSDTLIENPLIKNYLSKMNRLLGESAEKDGLPIKSFMVMPEYNNTYWTNIIGGNFMNEKEVTEQTVGAVQTENIPDQTDNAPNQPEQELTPEEKLKLREKQLEERENALIIKEQTMNVSKMLSDNNYPPELAELLRIDTDGEKNAETVKKVVEILNGRSRPIATVSTGIDHSSPSLISSYDNSDFMRGFNR